MGQHCLALHARQTCCWCSGTPAFRPPLSPTPAAFAPSEDILRTPSIIVSPRWQSCICSSILSRSIGAVAVRLTAPATPAHMVSRATRPGGVQPQQASEASCGDAHTQWPNSCTARLPVLQACLANPNIWSSVSAQLPHMKRLGTPPGAPPASSSLNGR